VLSGPIGIADFRLGRLRLLAGTED